MLEINMLLAIRSKRVDAWAARRPGNNGRSLFDQSLEGTWLTVIGRRNKVRENKRRRRIKNKNILSWTLDEN